MKYYSQYRSHDLFELHESLSGLNKSNRWVKLADSLPWDKIEKEYNKRLRNSHNGAGNKPARMVVGALIVKHVEKLSDGKTILAIQENPYMQYLLGLEKFTEKPVFVPELFVLIRKRLDHDFFNMLTLMLAEADGSRLIDRLLDKFCARHKIRKPQTHRMEARHAFITLTRKRRRGKKLVDSIVSGYTYVDHLSWDAYNESTDLGLQMELYRKRFGMLPKELQADRLYLGRANRKYIKACHVDCYNHPLGRPPKEENDGHAEDRKRAVGERNEIEGTFGTTKRVYRANDIRAKLARTADTWIGACFFAKNVMKFLRGLLCLIFEKSDVRNLQKRIIHIIDNFVAVLTISRGCVVEIN